MLTEYLGNYTTVKYHIMTVIMVCAYSMLVITHSAFVLTTFFLAYTKTT